MQHPPDGLTKGIRFGCGALLGLLIGVGAAVKLLPADTISEMLSIGLPSLVFGILAMQWGDGFWEWFRDYFWWFG